MVKTDQHYSPHHISSKIDKHINSFEDINHFFLCTSLFRKEEGNKNLTPPTPNKQGQMPIDAVVNKL